MTKRHFVDEYTTLVRDLMARYPLDEAMSVAVGGGTTRQAATKSGLYRHAV